MGKYRVTLSAELYNVMHDIEDVLSGCLIGCDEDIHGSTLTSDVFKVLIQINKGRDSSALYDLLLCSSVIDNEILLGCSTCLSNLMSVKILLCSLNKLFGEVPLDIADRLLKSGKLKIKTKE